MHYFRYIAFLGLVSVNGFIIHSILNSMMSYSISKENADKFLEEFHLMIVFKLGSIVNLILFWSPPLLVQIPFQIASTTERNNRLSIYFLHILFVGRVLVKSELIRTSTLSLVYWILCENLSLLELIYKKPWLLLSFVLTKAQT
jgi:hypothetical protein